MAKRLQKRDGKYFLQNGQTLVRMGFMHHLNLASHPGRIVKVFVIQEVLKQNPNNAIGDGAMIAISFREQDVNQREYLWKRGEEFQVPLKMVTADDLKIQHSEPEG